MRLTIATFLLVPSAKNECFLARNSVARGGRVENASGHANFGKENLHFGSN